MTPHEWEKLGVVNTKDVAIRWKCRRCNAYVIKPGPNAPSDTKPVGVRSLDCDGMVLQQIHNS